MTEYKKNYKGFNYSISHNFILDMENNREIDLIKEIENILDDEIQRKKEDDWRIRKYPRCLSSFSRGSRRTPQTKIRNYPIRKTKTKRTYEEARQ